MISFIVSVFDRTLPLMGCLVSLELQRESHEIVVVDDSDDYDTQQAHRATAGMLNAQYVAYGRMGSVYFPSQRAALELARGEWLCFPSDDSYYVPGFSTLMLKTAKDTGAQFVYSDLLHDHSNQNNYKVIACRPELSWIDKTNFMVRSSVFREHGGFPAHCPDFMRDGVFAGELVEKGVKCAGVGQVLVVHV